MDRIDTLVISDVHLEQADCQVRPLMNLLRSQYKRLIIAGDLYEIGSPIGDKEFEVINFLRGARERLIYVDGNHDRAERMLVNNIIGVKILKRFEWMAGGKRFCVMHGHRFDRFCFIFDEKLVDAAAMFFYRFINRVDRQKNHIAALVDRLHNDHARHFAERAARFAKRHGIDVIICGHTHKPLQRLFAGRGNGPPVEFFNCGSWRKDDVCRFVTVDEMGNARLCRAV